MPAPERVLRDPEAADDRATRGLRRTYPFRTVAYDDVAAYLDETGRTVADSVDTAPGDYETQYADGHVHPVLDVGPADARLGVRSIRGISVLETDLDDATAVEAFEAYEDNDFERVGEYEGYTLLGAARGPWVAAVADGTVVEAFENSGGRGPVLREPRAAVEAVVEARAGEDGSRYVESTEAVAALVDRLGDATLVSGTVTPEGTAADTDSPTGTARTPETSGTVSEGDPLAEGTALTIDGETTTARHVAVFGSADAADPDAVGGDGSPFADWSNASTSVDGRAVVAEGTRETAAVLDIESGPVETADG
ncbi:hypothetical protein I7X12_15675 [Halosimplex litoreum]|uniref:Uncharacterized protein n=1 Tax=Halosimplex litoreum TaxID=1198301 RepID=A0A7T3FXL3_9EURY|nr:hypothetical protein [Halosimplex litoreum]QPV62168.1 hypothetical protein I7X12_15675 [Halosimplex litoreum]